MPDGSTAIFNLYTYIFAALTLLLALLLSPKKNSSEDKTNINKFIGYIIVMAIFLFVNSYFKTLAAKHLNAVLLYPLNQACGLILSSLMATFLFKEKMTIKGIVGILTAFAGLLIINLI